MWPASTLRPWGADPLTNPQYDNFLRDTAEGLSRKAARGHTAPEPSWRPASRAGSDRARGVDGSALSGNEIHRASGLLLSEMYEVDRTSTATIRRSLAIRRPDGRRPTGCALPPARSRCRAAGTLSDWRPVGPMRSTNGYLSVRDPHERVTHRAAPRTRAQAWRRTGGERAGNEVQPTRPRRGWSKLRATARDLEPGSAIATRPRRSSPHSVELHRGKALLAGQRRASLQAHGDAPALGGGSNMKLAVRSASRAGAIRAHSGLPAPSVVAHGNDTALGGLHPQSAMPSS